VAAKQREVVTGMLIDDESVVRLTEICRACDVRTETVVEMVEYGILEPTGEEGAGWSFRADSLRRVRTVVRLQRDLDINLAGAALALDLLEEVEALRRRLRALERSEVE